MNTETPKRKLTRTRILGLTILVLGGLCMVLPIVGAFAAFGSLSELVLHLGNFAILALGIAMIFLAYYLYQEQRKK